MFNIYVSTHTHVCVKRMMEFLEWHFNPVTDWYASLNRKFLLLFYMPLCVILEQPISYQCHREDFFVPIDLTSSFCSWRWTSSEIKKLKEMRASSTHWFMILKIIIESYFYRHWKRADGLLMALIIVFSSTNPSSFHCFLYALKSVYKLKMWNVIG